MITGGAIVFVRLKSGGYRLIEDWWCDTGIEGCAAQIPGYIRLTQGGRLHVKRTYQWDGCSGPVIDRKANMRAGLAHDALYQLLRAGKLAPELRDKADRVFRRLYEMDGGWSFIGALDYWGLRWFAGYAAKPQPEVDTKALQAP